MAILRIYPETPAGQAGMVGVSPSIRYILTDDTTATVETAGYLAPAQNMGYQFNEQEIACVYTTDGRVTWYAFQIVDNVITLIPEVAPGGVVLPVVAGNFAIWADTGGLLEDAGYLPSDDTKTKVVMASAAVTANHIAVFSDTAGTVNDDAATAINVGDIQAGVNDEAGGFVSYPGAAAAGKLELRATGNASDYTTILTNSSQVQQSTTYTLADAGSATQSVLASTLTNPGFSSVIKCFDITAAFGSLSSGGAVGVVTGGGYKIREIYLNSGGTNFSGVGGDRNIQISDGTTVYSVIPAAIAQALVNARWGTAVTIPFPVSAAINTTTAATLFIAYSGGTTDYTAGSLTLSFVLQKVS